MCGLDEFDVITCLGGVWMLISGCLDCAKTAANSLLRNLVKDSARNRQSQP